MNLNARRGILTLSTSLKITNNTLIAINQTLAAINVFMYALVTIKGVYM